MSKSDYLYLLCAVCIALITPILLTSFIYPAFQVFLPEGNIILTPPLRVVATILMAVISYALAYIAIYRTSKRNKVLFNLISFLLTILWNIFIGIIWWIAVID